MSGLNDLKKCNNGHYYEKSLNRCPYCPPGQNADNDLSTEQKNTKSSFGEVDKTFIPSTNNEQETFMPKGENFANSQKTYVPGQDEAMQYESNKQMNQNIDFTRTYIPGMEEVKQEDGTKKMVESDREYRKLVGWLVCYDIDPAGVDYRLYEGKNSIGSAPDNQITIPDKTVSKKHANILYRNGKYRIKDEFSTTGTYVNGEEVEEDVKISDGDIIKIGKINVMIRTSIFPEQV